MSQSPYGQPYQGGGHGPSVPPGGGRRRSPWILPVAILGVLALLGALVLGGGALMWFLDPLDWRGGPVASSEDPTEGSTAATTTPDLAEGGTEDYVFSYPASWGPREDDGETPESTIYELSVEDVEGLNSFDVVEADLLGTGASHCWRMAEKNDYTPLGDIDLDGQVVKHFQSRAPSDAGVPRVRDVWCAEGRNGSSLMIIGRTTNPEADGLETSAGLTIVETWRWKD